MANTEGGILYLGVEDDDEITGDHKKHNDPIGAMALIANLTLQEIAEVTNIADARAKANVEKLVEAGLVEATGTNKSRSYILSSKVYKSQDNMVGYVRQKGIDSVKYEAWIMELAQKQNRKFLFEELAIKMST